MDTVVDCGVFYRDHRVVIVQTCAERRLKLPMGYEDECEAIVDALLPFRTLTEPTEAGETTLAQFHLLQLQCKDAWARMGREGNAIAEQLLHLYEARFTTTGDSLQNELAYVFTLEGHAHYRAMLQHVGVPVDECVASGEAIEAFSQRLPAVRAKMIELIRHMLPASTSTDVELGSIFNAYLACSGFWSVGEDARTGWATKRARRAGVWERQLGCTREVWLNFGAVAEILTQMPASEAAAERLFSVFDCVFKKNRMAAHLDLLNATLTIRPRMWQIYHRRETELDGESLAVRRVLPALLAG
jgi:hypothetical protein